MPTSRPVLVTGAAGQVGGIGRLLVETLRDRGVPVRAVVRSDDARAAALRLRGAEVAVADLTRPEQVLPVLDVCTRGYFGMSVSPSYLEATPVMASAARALRSRAACQHVPDDRVADGPHHNDRLAAAPAALAGRAGAQLVGCAGRAHPSDGVPREPVVYGSGGRVHRGVRHPSVAVRDWPPSPVAARDVAEVIAAILLDPGPYVGQVVELTGPRSVDLNELADEYSSALGRPVTYVPVPLEDWRAELNKRALPDHLSQHLLTMAELRAANRYDRHTDGIARIQGRAPTSLRETAMSNRQLFQPSGPASQCQ